MSEADIKLKIIRLIDSQQGQALLELYDLILRKLYKENGKKEPLSALELAYKEMAEDHEREQEAFEWIEGTLNMHEL